MLLASLHNLFYVITQWYLSIMCPLHQRKGIRRIYVSFSAQQASRGYNVTYSDENSLKVNVIFKELTGNATNAMV